MLQYHIQYGFLTKKSPFSRKNRKNFCTGCQEDRQPVRCWKIVKFRLPLQALSPAPHESIVQSRPLFVGRTAVLRNGRGSVPSALRIHAPGHGLPIVDGRLIAEGINRSAASPLGASRAHLNIKRNLLCHHFPSLPLVFLFLPVKETS